MSCRTNLFYLSALKTGRILSIAALAVLALALAGCAGANTTTPGPDAPVTYADVLARFQQIRTDYGGIDDRLLSYKKYADALVGKRAIAWSAWVMAINENQNSATNNMTVLLQDPAGQDADHIVYFSADQKTSVGEPDTTTFSNRSASQVANLKPGQQLTFSGVISGAYQQLSFNNVNFTAIAPTPSPAQSPQPLPSDLEIGLQESPTELAPQETITINAAGHVHVDFKYLDQSSTPTLPSPIDKTVPVDQVADLVALFAQINYNSLHSYLLESDCTTLSSVDQSAMTKYPLNTWIKQNGNRHDVYTNNAVSCIPAKLHMVEDAIRQVAGVDN